MAIQGLLLELSDFDLKRWPSLSLQNDCADSDPQFGKLSDRFTFQRYYLLSSHEIDWLP